MIVATPVNADQYGELLAHTLPRVIETEDEYERILNKLETLLRRGGDRSVEERELSKLLTALVEGFEERNYLLQKATPLEALQELMSARDMKQVDLIPLFGSKGIVSEVINGKRELSKTHIRAVAAFFNVSPELFI